MKSKKGPIKERAIYVYLPSEELVKEWKALAKKQGLSISKFVIEHVQNSLMQEKEPTYLSRAEIAKKAREQEEEISKLRKENRMLRLAYEKLDSELKHYRAKPFLEEFEGIRKYEKELIKVLKSKKFVGAQELLDILGIDPKETQLVKAISKQLENLEAYALVEALPNGWRWVG